MEIEIQDVREDELVPQIESNARKANGKKVLVVPVDDEHPFELDSFMSSYSGRIAIYRLCHIMTLAPSLADQAFARALQLIKAGRDAQFYSGAVAIYNQHANAEHQKTVDAAWVDDVNSKNAAERNKLEVELKTYQSNMIKESIRMAHRDLGNHFRATGDEASALKHYQKSREFSTQGQQVLDMCISLLELVIEQRQYAHVSTYLVKAEGALDLTSNTGPVAGKTNVSGGLLHKETTTQKKPTSPDREKVQAKLDVAQALAHLGQGNYEKAANAFLKIGSPNCLEDWNGKVISPSDIAIYGVLCALASKSRSAIKAQLLESSTFNIYMEYEPYVRNLVDAYMASKFKTVLEILNQYSTRHYLDIHLYSHIHDLTNLIRDRALALYFKPFASIKLERMAIAFGLSSEELEKLVIGLIKCGEIHARIDSRNKILKAKIADERQVLFSRAARAGTQMEATNRKLLLRMRIQQADLVVKQPKHQGPPTVEQYMMGQD